MKIVVIGGNGLIGRKLVRSLVSSGHEALAASPSSGVNVLTGEGLANAMGGAVVVVDVSNSPSFEDEAAMQFFRTAARNLLAAETRAGIRHHVSLSVVGTERLLASGYFRAKLVQEEAVASGGIPWSIVRSTQFFEFAGGIADFSMSGGAVHLPPVAMQPIVSDDVAAAVANVALGEPLGGIVEVAGPEPVRMDDFVGRHLRAHGDARAVVADPSALYFGIAVDDRSLMPGHAPRLGSTRYDDWLAASAKPGAPAVRH